MVWCDAQMISHQEKCRIFLVMSVKKPYLKVDARLSTDESLLLQSQLVPVTSPTERSTSPPPKAARKKKSEKASPSLSQVLGSQVSRFPEWGYPQQFQRFDHGFVSFQKHGDDWYSTGLMICHGWFRSDSPTRNIEPTRSLKHLQRRCCIYSDCSSPIYLISCIFISHDTHIWVKSNWYMNYMIVNESSTWIGSLAMLG